MPRGPNICELCGDRPPGMLVVLPGELSGPRLALVCGRCAARLRDREAIELLVAEKNERAARPGLEK